MDFNYIFSHKAWDFLFATCIFEKEINFPYLKNKKDSVLVGSHSGGCDIEILISFQSSLINISRTQTGRKRGRGVKRKKRQVKGSEDEGMRIKYFFMCEIPHVIMWVSIILVFLGWGEFHYSK